VPQLPDIGSQPLLLDALLLQVQANPQNAPAWRLLGTVHAENDDDRQVRMEHVLLLLQYCCSCSSLLMSCGQHHGCAKYLLCHV
jgi:hypothetical protein